MLQRVSVFTWVYRCCAHTCVGTGCVPRCCVSSGDSAASPFILVSDRHKCLCRRTCGMARACVQCMCVSIDAHVPHCCARTCASVCPRGCPLVPICCRSEGRWKGGVAWDLGPRRPQHPGRPGLPALAPAPPSLSLTGTRVNKCCFSPILLRSMMENPQAGSEPRINSPFHLTGWLSP